MVVLSISTRKLKPRSGSTRVAEFATVKSSLAGVGSHVQGDLDDHELGRLDRRYPNESDQAAVVDVVLRHGGEVAADEEGLVWRGALQAAGVPDGGQEVADQPLDAGPELRLVGLED